MDNSIVELALLDKILNDAKMASEPSTEPFKLNLDGPFPADGEVTYEDLKGTVDESWPVYGQDDIGALILDPPPYPVDIYMNGKKEHGLIGVVTAEGVFKATIDNVAPVTARHWEDDCACFRPHTVVWNGVPGVVETDSAGVARRTSDGSLMGEWPINPPRKEKLRNPEKARLAGEENNG